MNHSGFGEGIGSDKFVVRRMERYSNNTDFLGYPFGAPRKVAGVKSKSTVLAIASSGSDEMDTFVSDTSISRLATSFKRSLFAVKGTLDILL